MKYNKENIKVGDRVKVISTDDQLAAIGLSGENLKGQIAVVLRVNKYWVNVQFHTGVKWSLRFKDFHKVVE